jgi:hypothetical protein
LISVPPSVTTCPTMVGDDAKVPGCKPKRTERETTIDLKSIQYPQSMFVWATQKAIPFTLTRITLRH